MTLRQSSGKAAMTEDELRQFNEAGAVTIDTPLTRREIAAAADAFDRLMPRGEGQARTSLTCSYFDPAIVDILQHPFFEKTARQALQTEHVRFFQTAMVTAYPEPGKLFSFWQHVDIQYQAADFRSVPRQIICSFFLWLTDVNERRAPMMFRPGSHLQIADIREKDPAWPESAVVAPTPLDKLPVLPYSEPVPLTAHAGQVSVLTTAAVHGASVNVDSEPRKNLVLTFVPAGLKIGLPPREEQQTLDYCRALHPLFREDRRHILPIAPN
jgi:ectoine hydroxylase-related dioxygenase (phytanoyl-CoA dioxygenase family)